MNVNFYQQEGNNIVGFHDGDNGLCLMMRPVQGYSEEDRLQGMDKLCVSTDEGSVYEELISWSVNDDTLHVELGEAACELGLPQNIDGELPPDDSEERQKIIDFLSFEYKAKEDGDEPVEGEVVDDEKEDK